MAIKLKLSGTQAPVQVYRFGTQVDGDRTMGDLLGGKGANLADMSVLGVNVPSGFTIPTSACNDYFEASASIVKKKNFLSRLWKGAKTGVEYITAENEGVKPLVSVRSGARVSMPGMMDTVLNIGLTNKTMPQWEVLLGSKTAWDSYRRLLQMYGSVVCGINESSFAEILSMHKKSLGVTTDQDLTVQVLKMVCDDFQTVFSAKGKVFPQTFSDQLKGATLAVFESWHSERAKEYRKIYGFEESWGTAVNIQTMVFGNQGDSSGSGVLFTSDPSDGSSKMVGEYLINAQGEDVVAGVRTPFIISSMSGVWSNIFEELSKIAVKLETHYKDMQDVEFTIQKGKLFILQTRNGKRSSVAKFRIAHDLYSNGVISQDEMFARLSSGDLGDALRGVVDPAFKTPPTFKGIAAGGGVVAGKACLTSEAAINCTEPAILIRKETSPEDIAGINASVGVLTYTGGLTSHAAVVARGMDKSCVVGAEPIQIPNGSKVVIDGSTGNVWVHIDVPILNGAHSPEINRILEWAAGRHSGKAEVVSLTTGEDSATSQKIFERCHAKTVCFDVSELGGQEQRLSLLGQDRPTSLENLIIAFDGVSPEFSKADTKLFEAFGAGFRPGCLLDMKAALSAIRQWPKSARKNTVLMLPKSYTPAACKDLRKQGFIVPGAVATVSDLLNAAGPMTVSDEVLLNVFGGIEAYDDLLALLGKDKKALINSSLPEFITTDQLLA